MEVIPVTGRKTMKAFVNFPRTIYRENPWWAPPIWRDEKNAYRGRSNVMLRENDYILFLVYHRGVLLGRTLVYVDSNYNSYYQTSTGFFGAFECFDNQEAADLLMSESVKWLAERGMESIMGPIHPVAESWGFLLKGYESTPVLMAPYNPSYYHSLMENFGLGKVKDLYAYEAEISAGYQIPDRIERFTGLFMESCSDFSLRKINLKNLMMDAEFIWEITNISLKDNWGFVPVDKLVLKDMVRRLKPLLNPDAVWFVEDNGIPVGFALGFPDPNPIIREINGKLFPTGFIRFLTGKKHLQRYRLISLGVLPEYHGLGLDALLYKQLNDSLGGKISVLEANYILEDNWKIRNALEKLNLVRTKEYRIYEMAL